MTATKPLEFWFEFASTYSYLGIEAAAALDIPVSYKAFLLGPIFAAQGWQDSPFNLYPAKGRYMWRDMQRLCGDAGLPFRVPSQFPRSGLLAARVCIAHESAPWLPVFARSVYRANFGEDREISQESVIVELLEALQLNAEEIVEAASSRGAKAGLREQTERATALGIFGAPTWVVDGELFWGSDRVAQAVAWWKKREREASR
jgi:2-hydroxychromene-2-carboxylate isomerase